VNGILSALLLLIVSAPLTIQPQLKLVHLRGNVYVVEDSYYSQENSAVYIGEEYVTVVGATWTPETAKLLADEIAKITKKPIREVIDTNYHPDRAGGNGYFRQIGARIVSTRMTYELLRSQGDAVAAATHKVIPAYTVPPLVLPDTIYDENFDLQSGRVKGLYLGPSHTPDGIFVYFPEEKVLYGNCILKENLGNLDYANLDEYPKTLLKLQQLQLGYTTIIAGHWSPVHGPELVDQYLELLRRRRESSALSH
jgi:metallo-beta-lactamase class B